MLPTTALLSILALLAGTQVQAATKDQWRSRSVYQLLTDRFAPPTPDAPCDLKSYCGGSWKTIVDRLDYIQGMGFDAIWISPTGLGLEGYTKWGENYHGFWSVDPFAINPHFGTAEDLKALSSALHSRGMYLMVDIAVNHLAATDTDISDQALAAKSGGKLLFKEEKDFHPACHIQWGTQSSEQTCWLAQDGVTLMDLRTEDAPVASILKQRFAAYMQEYNIDGARVDASKHMTKQFQHEFCGEANTFCIGEVYDGSTAVPASYTKGDGIDSVFGFGMMWGAVDVFAKDRPMSALSSRAREASTSYGDPTVIGAILDNHDLPRFNSLTNDKSNVYNAMALQFLFGGIPTMYYGLEQDITFGASDPDNRAPLWQYGGLGTDGESYKRITKLNGIRNKLGELGGFHEVVGEVVEETDNDIAFERNGALLVLTKRGAGQGGAWTVANAGFPANAKLIDLLSCSTATAGADGSLKVTFDNGLPFFYVIEDVALETEICGAAPVTSSTSGIASSTSSSASSSSSPSSASASSSGSALASASASPSPSPSAASSTLGSASSSAASTVLALPAEVTPSPSVSPVDETPETGLPTTAPDTGPDTPIVPGPIVPGPIEGETEPIPDQAGEQPSSPQSSSTRSLPALQPTSRPGNGQTSGSCKRRRSRRMSGESMLISA